MNEKLAADVYSKYRKEIRKNCTEGWGDDLCDDLTQLKEEIHSDVEDWLADYEEDRQVEKGKKPKEE